jgi:hypothetical protein
MAEAAPDVFGYDKCKFSKTTYQEQEVQNG